MNGFVFVFVYLRWGQTRLMGAALEDKEMEEVEEEGSWQWIRSLLSFGVYEISHDGEQVFSGTRWC